MPTIAPDDPNIIYSPANWDVTAVRARTLYNGAYLRVHIDGATTISLAFDLTDLVGVMPKIAYRVDDGSWTRVDVAATVVLTVPASNLWSRRLLEVVYDTKKQFSSTTPVSEWQGASDVKLTGIVVDAGTTVAVAPRPSKGVIFGDSISRGVFTLSHTANADSRDNSVRQGYSWGVLNSTNAEVGICAIGATGWNDAGPGGEPEFSSWSTGAMWSGGPTRDLTGLDWVLINHGQNDAENAATTTAVTATLNNILAAVDAGTKIIVLRPFSGKAAAQIVAGIAACNFPSRITYVDTTGWWSTSTDPADDDVHPLGDWHRTVGAPLVTQAIENATAPPPAPTGRWIKTSTGIVAV